MPWVLCNSTKNLAKNDVLGLLLNMQCITVVAYEHFHYMIGSVIKKLVRYYNVRYQKPIIFNECLFYTNRRLTFYVNSIFDTFTAKASELPAIKICKLILRLHI